ncbi:hypothetical protein KC19_1G295600 [Ceratodon purpureus]|uniref:Protein kinase domain-containing protein n=1 Tax=Ceratodon purpureus TaxID=3225 RepID=A0A8T0JD88_CERPU|nr:hypothetical protein KC19_1G295600 [Ceratodon purpureus]
MSKLQGKYNMPHSMTVDVGPTSRRAPEVSRNGDRHKYSFPGDVRSYGVTYHEILNGEVPFEGVTYLFAKSSFGLSSELPASCSEVDADEMLVHCSN